MRLVAPTGKRLKGVNWPVSAELHHGAARAKGLRAPAEVVGRTVWLGKPRGVPAVAQIFHRKGPRGRNGPSADGVRNAQHTHRSVFLGFCQRKVSGSAHYCVDSVASTIAELSGPVNHDRLLATMMLEMRFGGSTAICNATMPPSDRPQTMTDPTPR